MRYYSLCHFFLRSDIPLCLPLRSRRSRPGHRAPCWRGGAGGGLSPPPPLHPHTRQWRRGHGTLEQKLEATHFKRGNIDFVRCLRTPEIHTFFRIKTLQQATRVLGCAEHSPEKLRHPQILFLLSPALFPGDTISRCCFAAGKQR